MNQTDPLTSIILSSGQWGDLDFHGQFIEVRHAIVRRQITLTRTRKIRRVDMSPQFARVLRREGHAGTRRSHKGRLTGALDLLRPHTPADEQ